GARAVGSAAAWSASIPAGRIVRAAPSLDRVGDRAGPDGAGAAPGSLSRTSVSSRSSRASPSTPSSGGLTAATVGPGSESAGAPIIQAPITPAPKPMANARAVAVDNRWREDTARTAGLSKRLLPDLTLSSGRRRRGIHSPVQESALLANKCQQSLSPE